MAFESVTDLTGGKYRFNNVWRGLLDTPARAHAVGARGFLVNANMVGRRGWSINKSVDVGLVPRSLFVLGSGEDPVDLYETPERDFLPDGTFAGGRGLLPMPLADFY